MGTEELIEKVFLNSCDFLVDVALTVSRGFLILSFLLQRGCGCGLTSIQTHLAVQTYLHQKPENAQKNWQKDSYIQKSKQVWHFKTRL